MQHPPTQVLEALAQSPLRWILAFDNAGPPDSLPSLDALGSGRVLLTSRDPDWAGYGPTLEFEPCGTGSPPRSCNVAVPTCERSSQRPILGSRMTRDFGSTTRRSVRILARRS